MAYAPNQSSLALERANHVKRERVALRSEIRSLPTAEGLALLADTICNPPECVRTATVFDALAWPAGVGPRGQHRLWLRCGLPVGKCLGSLTPRQAAALAELLVER